MTMLFPARRSDKHLEASHAAEDDSAGPAEPVSRTCRLIGDHIRDVKQLTDIQIDAILQFQRQHDVRFGEAAVALKVVSQDDVLQALAKQFEFPYAAASCQKLSPDLVVAHDPGGILAERFRDLRTRLLMSVLAANGPRHALAILSPNEGDGKSFIAANLAISLSQIGTKTLLIDANMRTARLHKMFQTAKTAGLSNILAGRVGPVPVESVEGFPSLYVLGAGGCPPNPLELLERPALGRMLQEWSRRFDQIIVDTPCDAICSDGQLLAAKCGASLVVARPGHTHMKSIDKLVSDLRDSPTSLAGVVLNEH